MRARAEGAPLVVLVITRRKRERILIGAVELVVLEIHRGRVRLGFTAPLGTRIVRFELIAVADDAPPPGPRSSTGRGTR